jgi:replicative DNA helicase
MLLSKDAIAEVVSLLRGVDFYKLQHEMVFDAITDIYARGEPVDAVTVSAELTRVGAISRIGGPAYLATLIATVPTAASAAYYAQIVRERAIMRRLVEAGTRITQLGYATDGESVDELVNTAQAEVYAVTERQSSEDYQAIRSVVDPLLTELENVTPGDGVLMGVPTGFSKLDALTGGLRGGQMVIVAARPAIGKSTLGLDFARSAAIRNRQTTVIFSLEMSRSEITHRLLSAESGVLLQHFRRGSISPADWTRIVSRLEAIKNAPLFIDDSPNMALMEIRAKCRRLKQRHDLKMVIIDYIQLMSSGKRVESRQQEVSEFSRALKLLAKELDVPVVAISQLNRASEQREGKKPQMSDLRESGSLEQDADVVMLLHRTDVGDKKGEPGSREAAGGKYAGSPLAEGEAQLIVAKHRNGPTATIKLAFRGHVAQFSDMAEGM